MKLKSLIKLFQQKNSDQLNLKLIKNPLNHKESKEYMKIIDDISNNTPRDITVSTRQILNNKIIMNSVFWFLLLNNNSSIGYFRCTPVQELNGKTYLELNEFTILPQYQQKGFGRQFITILITLLHHDPSYNQCKLIRLDCNTNKQWLINFYKQIGFTIVGKSFKTLDLPHITMEYIIKQ